MRSPSLPPIVIVAPGAEMPTEAEPFVAALRCKVLRPSDLMLWLRHLAHALLDPMPAPAPRTMMRPEPEPEQLSAADLAESPEPLLCRRCRAEVTPTAGKGPHAAQARCTSCGQHRWISRAELQHAGIDPASLSGGDDADSQLTLGGRL